MDVFSSEERPWYGRYNHEPRFAGLMTIGGVSRADEDIREGVVARIGRPVMRQSLPSPSGVSTPFSPSDEASASGAGIGGI